MDALQFGQWLSEQRRRHGWRSQRAFVEVAQQEPLLRELHISEDFMGRLEAGLLVHPFRGTVRRRVLALSWLLCKTPRELQAYLRAAELGKLSDEEKDFLGRVTRAIIARQAPAPLLLPPRPARLMGRALHLQDLLRACSSVEQGICAITGMPGVGKSALACEAVHRLAANEAERLRLFPDGIVTLTCTGRSGHMGLLSLLDELVEIFSTAKQSGRNGKKACEQADAASPEGALAGAIDRARMALAGRRALLLLDDLDAEFPLRLACDALLARGLQRAGAENCEGARMVILTTSRQILPPLLTAFHIHLEPLELDAARELFIALLGRVPAEEEDGAVRRICAAVGNLPLAIEEAATTAVVEGIPLELLAVRAEEDPLDRLLDRAGEIRSRVSRALKTMNPQIGQRFALLSLLGAQFGLEVAAAIQRIEPARQLTLPDSMQGNGRRPGQQGLIVPGCASAMALPLSGLASTAADLGQLVRHSLIELAPPVIPARDPSITQIAHSPLQDKEIRYRLHPLILAHASDSLRYLDAETRQVAQQNVRAYALDYVQRYGRDVERLERERHFLAAVVERAWDEQQCGLVIDLVWDLRPILCLGPGFIEEPVRLLHLGAAASQQLHQYQHFSRFMNHLAVLLYETGDLARAIQVWREALDIVETYEGPRAHFPWLPLINLAEMHSLLGNHDNAQRHADAFLQRAQQGSDAVTMAGALFFRGRIERRRGEADCAYDDLRESARLFASVPEASLSPSIIADKLSLQAELARVQGEYEKACEYTWQLSQAFGGRRYCDIAEAWLDQAHYAYQKGRLDDARVMAQRALDLAAQSGAHYFCQRSMELLSRLTEVHLEPARWQ